MVDCITGLFEQISYSYLFPWNFKVPPMKRVEYIFPYLGFIWNKAENLVAWSIPTSSCFYLHSCTSAFLRRMCLLVPGWKRHKVKLSSLPLHMAFFFFFPSWVSVSSPTHMRTPVIRFPVHSKSSEVSSWDH